MGSKIASNIDSITVEIVGNLLSSIAEEVGVALVKSSYSSNIKERRDCSAAIFDADGNLVAQGEHMPMHLGSMLESIKAVLNAYGIDQIEEGDMFISNDPYNGGGSHLPDFVIIAPVFAKGNLISWVTNIAHHSDIGGIAPGSTSGEVTSIFQEGLCIPAIKICSKGSTIREVFQLIVNNSRMKKERIGDINAQIAANRIGIKRVVNAYEKYGERLFEAMTDLQTYAEEGLRAGVEQLQDGIYHFSDYIDDIEDDILIDVEIKTKGRNITLDFSKTSVQVPANINVTYGGLQATVFYSLKSLIGPNLPSNSGIFNAFKVIAKPGTIVNAVSPGPLGERMSTCQRVVEVILGALYPVMSNKVLACSHDGGTSVNFSGHDARRNNFFIYPEGIAGGEGAASYRDGMDGIQVHMTNSSNLPVEVLEMETPLLIKEYSLIKDSGGAGKYQGGRGIHKEVMMLKSNILFTGHGGRQRLAAWGLDHGLKGSKGAFYHIGKDNEKQLAPSCNNVVLNKGDIIKIVTPGGGGFGDPLLRSRELVKKDIENGVISLHRAKEVYSYSEE